MSRTRTILLLLCLLAPAACGEDAGKSRNTSPATNSHPPATTTPPEPSPSEITLETTGPAEKATNRKKPAPGTPEPETAPDYGYTYGQPSGNRTVDGTGNLSDSSPAAVRLGGEPVWVAGVPLGESIAWVVTLKDGRVKAFRQSNSGEMKPEPITPNLLPSGAPPLVKAEGGSLKLVTLNGGRGSPLTHPVKVGAALLSIGEDGGVSVDRGNGPPERPPVTALPGARIVRSSGARQPSSPIQCAGNADASGRRRHLDQPCLRHGWRGARFHRGGPRGRRLEDLALKRFSY